MSNLYESVTVKYWTREAFLKLPNGTRVSDDTDDDACLIIGPDPTQEGYMVIRSENDAGLYSEAWEPKRWRVIDEPEVSP